MTFAALALWPHIGPVLTSEINNRIAYVGAKATGEAGSELDDKCEAEIKSLWAELRKRIGLANK